MRGRTVSLMYALNIVLQSIFTLLFSTGFFVGIAYLLVARAGVGGWVYIPAVILGLGFGIFSMMTFVYRAMIGLERLEIQREREENKERGDADGKA